MTSWKKSAASRSQRKFGQRWEKEARTHGRTQWNEDLVVAEIVVQGVDQICSKRVKCTVYWRYHIYEDNSEIIALAEERDKFFSGVATDKVPILLWTNPWVCSCIKQTQSFEKKMKLGRGNKPNWGVEKVMMIKIIDKLSLGTCMKCNNVIWCLSSILVILFI